MKREFANLAELTQAIPNEAAAVDYFTNIRWKNGAFCPLCGSKSVYTFPDKVTHKCRGCTRRFSIKVGTVMEGTKIEVRKWLFAIWFLTSHKKSISSVQLAKDIGVTQKTSWFMMHRLRHAARTRSFNRSLKGKVEADELYVGGIEKNKHRAKRGLARKSVVFGMLERGGELRTQRLDRMYDAKRLLEAHVDPEATLLTDEWPGYKGVKAGKERLSVTHRAGEYVRDGYIHTNTIESYWSQFRRQVYGTHHWVSHKHLQRYLNENTWRFNRRELDERPRMDEFISRLDGRLTYPALIQ